MISSMFKGFKVLIIISTILSIIVGLLYFNVESVQKKVFDVKADLVGTNRTITFYTNLTGEPLKSYSDKSMRFEVSPEGNVSVWLGSINKKVYSNMYYIVEDK